MVKTKKTLIKRVKITKSGKILKKQNNMGHLNSKLSANKKHRKGGTELVETHGYQRKIKALLGKRGRKVKIK